jgi:hypothetical protein
MKVDIILLFLLLGTNLVVGVDIPASIKAGEWDYQVDAGVRGGARSINDPTKPVSLPMGIWDEVGRQMVLVPTDTFSAKRMQEEKTWGSFLFRHVQSLDQLLICQFSDLPADKSIIELNPIPTPEQERFLRNIVKEWFPPLPEGFFPVGAGGGASLGTWKPVTRGLAQIESSRSAVRKNKFGGIIERIYWYNRQLSVDEALISCIGFDSKLDPVNEFGHSLLLSHFYLADDQYEYLWQSR